jgi:hypothetical protein
MSHEDSSVVFVAEPVDWSDLFRKLRSILEFATHVCSKEIYGDWLMVFYDGDKHKPCKNVELIWSCHFMDAMARPWFNPSTDKREHEALLRKHLESFDLVVDKHDGWWKITLSTPTHPRSERGSSVLVRNNALTPTVVIAEE